MSEDQKEKQNSASGEESVLGFLRIFNFGIPFVVVIILILAVAGGSGYGVYKYPQVFGLAVTSDDAAIQAEAERLIDKVGVLIELPSDEKPTIATVSDVDSLRGSQPFFAKAENGDKVLIYATARKAILYREETNKIVDVGAVNINQSATTSGQVVDSEDTDTTDLENVDIESSSAEEDDATPEPTTEPTEEE